MTDARPLKSVSYSAPNSDRPTLNLVVEGQEEPFRFTVDRDQLLSINTQTVDVLLKRAPQ